VVEFWRKVNDVISVLIEKILPLDTMVMLLCDMTDLHLSESQRRVWLAGTTAAKKILVQKWIPPHQLPFQQ
jgi:hypothetical protein